ncbi:FMN-dependent dehydrogenase [Parasponia andersonii]|uniref:FMN-dependent dehydrogenase n=1 Tax=Parasponia andersonii TaxID=3476 RepID=A0A2P5B457_PARAD|nr:FMN-dependent dehydrogenase [Parasponia andersonii]
MLLEGKFLFYLTVECGEEQMSSRLFSPWCTSCALLYGLAAMGENGVGTVIEMLKNEHELIMALSGCRNLKDIKRSHVMTQHESLHSKI